MAARVVPRTPGEPRGPATLEVRSTTWSSTRSDVDGERINRRGNSEIKSSLLGNINIRCQRWDGTGINDQISRIQRTRSKGKSDGKNMMKRQQHDTKRQVVYSRRGKKRGG